MVFPVLLKFYTTITIPPPNYFICFSSSLLISLPFCTLECRFGAMSTLNGNKMISVELNI